MEHPSAASLPSSSLLPCFSMMTTTTITCEAAPPTCPPQRPAKRQSLAHHDARGRRRAARDDSFLTPVAQLPVDAPGVQVPLRDEQAHVVDLDDVVGETIFSARCRAGDETAPRGGGERVLFAVTTTLLLLLVVGCFGGAEHGGRAAATIVVAENKRAYDGALGAAGAVVFWVVVDWPHRAVLIERARSTTQLAGRRNEDRPGDVVLVVCRG